MGTYTKNIVILLLIYSNYLFSQKVVMSLLNFDKIQKSDTIYVFFKEESYKQLFFPQQNGYGDYYYYYDKYYESKYINFYHSPLSPGKIRVRKAFLNKHKDVLIDYNYLVNMYSYANAKEFLLKKKKIYLIDYNQIGWFTVLLKEVKVNDVNYNPIE